jgi:hypothetical protein
MSNEEMKQSGSCNKSEKLLHTIASNNFKKCLNLNIIEKSNEQSKDGHNFIFHAQNNFSKFELLVPIKKNNSETIAKCLNHFLH